MAGFFKDNPPATQVGSEDATESTIQEDAVTQTDTSGGFYQGSPDQTTTDAYTADALASKNAAEAAKIAAEAAQAASESAKTAAETAETNAETAETNAETAETNAETAETNAAASESAAATSAAQSASSASQSASSASSASASETAAASSATSASNSSNTSTAKAGEAAASAANAATSESNASSSATTATTQATNSAASAASSLTAKNASEAAQVAAETAESNAASSATSAASSATSASGSATTATTQAGTSTTQAGNSATSATAASNSASSAASAQTAAEAARDSALAALDSFDDRYLGSKSSAPTVDNDGNALVSGALYFDSTTNAMKVYDGSQWLNAYASLSGALLANQNLSDLNNSATARTNLGLGSAATTAASDYATAAQGTTADNALAASSVSTFGGTLIDDADASTARTTLGLGTAATTDATAYATAAQADQTVSLTGSGATSVSGTYPNFTITSTDTNTDTNTTYTAGSGITLTGTVFSNSAPDQTVALTGSGGTTVSGTYPNFTISSAASIDGTTINPAAVQIGGTTVINSSREGSFATRAQFGGIDSAGNVAPPSNNTIVSGYGLIGNRGTMYITNGGGAIQLGNGGIHNGDSGLSVETTVVDVGSGRSLAMNGTTVIDSSRNLTNVGTLNGGTPYTTANDTLLMHKGADIPGSVNLNSYTANGFYHQNSNSSATSGSNYPVNAAGMLTVTSDGLMVYQTYHQYNGNAYYHRSYYNGNWYAWRKVWTDGNDGSGSGLDADLLDGIDSTYFNRGDNGYGVMVGTSGWNMNDLFTTRNRSGFFDVWSGSNFPPGTSHVHGMQVRHNSSAHYGWQLAGQYGQNKLWHRQVQNNSWGAWNQQWGSGNDGSGSGLDADLLDGLHASSLVRSDAADTMSGTYTFSGGHGAINITSSSILSSASSNWTGDPGTSGKIQYHSNRWYIVGDSSSNRIVQFRRNNSDKSYIDNNGTLVGGGMWSSYNDGSGSGLDADTCDGQHLGTTANPTFNTVKSPGANADVRFSVWSGTTYGIGMHSGVTLGHLNDYAMTFCMNNDADRGFWWGYSGQAKSAGAMSLTTGGRLWVNSDITTPNLYVGDGNDGLFYSDSNGRTAFASGDFYLQTSVANYYNYATNIYLGNTSGDTVRFRGNTVTHNGFTFNSSGDLSTTRDIVSSARNRGVFGTYNSSQTDHIWSMGTAYRNHSSGANFGNLYGLAYKHTNNSTGGSMAGGHMMVWCQNGSGTSAIGSNIWTSGNVTAYSDIRVKTNIEHIPNALDKVCQLNGYTFDRTDVNYDDKGEPDKPIRQTGVIAQEVLEVLPEAVSGDEEGHYSVAYGNMVGLLIESIKELKAEVDDLKAQLEAK